MLHVTCYSVRCKFLQYSAQLKFYVQYRMYSVRHTLICLMLRCRLLVSDSVLLVQVVVTDLTHPTWKYYFPCGQWLAKDEDDGAICRDLAGSKDPLAMRKGRCYSTRTNTCLASNALKWFQQAFIHHIGLQVRVCIIRVVFPMSSYPISRLQHVYEQTCRVQGINYKNHTDTNSCISLGRPTLNVTFLDQFVSTSAYVGSKSAGHTATSKNLL